MSLIAVICLFGLLIDFSTIILVLRLNKQFNDYMEEQDAAREVEEKLQQRENDYRSALMLRLDEVQNARFSSLHKTLRK